MGFSFGIQATAPKSIAAQTAILIFALTGCGSDSSSSNDSSDEDTELTLEETIPQCSGDPWENFSVSSISAPSPDSQAYVVPANAQRTAITNSLNAFFDASYQSAVSHSTDAAYDICHMESTIGPLVFWFPQTAGEGHARWVIRASDTATPLMVQAPHSFFESHTMQQAVEIFTDLNARAVIVNGGHRCANTGYSSCSGTTSVCGESEPFRESDMAHVVDSFFQVAHQRIAQAYSDVLTINLHGMSRDGFSLSNGTSNDTNAQSPVAKLYTELIKEFPNETVTICNRFDSTTATNHLCGTTNVQGRFLNDSTKACTASASIASDRFIHLEQNLSIRESEANRSKIIQALDVILSQ